MIDRRFDGRQGKKRIKKLSEDLVFWQEFSITAARLYRKIYERGQKDQRRMKVTNCSFFIIN